MAAKPNVQVSMELDIKEYQKLNVGSSSLPSPLSLR